MNSTLENQSFDAGLSALRQGMLGLLHLAPDEIAKSLDALTLAQRTAVFAALSTISHSAKELEPLLRNIAGLNDRQENTRRAFGTEPNRIYLPDTAVFLKESKLNFDMRTRGKSESEILEDYRRENQDVERILSAHEQHLHSVQSLSRIFANAGVTGNFYVLDTLDPNKIAELVSKAQLVISLGGDDHFKAVAQYITDGLVLVMNSDARYSQGAIAYYCEPGFAEVIERLQSGEFLIEDWSRLQVVTEQWKNGEKVSTYHPQVISELVIADASTWYTMRGTANIERAEHTPALEMRLKTAHGEFPMKGSGAIIATGVGGPGWFSSAAKYVYPLGRKWPRTEQRAELIIREPYGEPKPKDVYHEVLLPGDKLVVVSSSNHSPAISGESVWVHPLPRGARATVSISPTPMRVISDIKP